VGNYLALTNSRFINNTATYSGGGAIYMGGGGTLDTANLLFDQNNASMGAALYLSGVTGELDFATIARPTNTNTNPAIEMVNSTTLTLEDSIISSYGEGVDIDSSTLTEDYNLFFNNTTNFNAYAGGTANHGGHSIGNQDPLFVNPPAGDYHLRRNSPAIGAGFNLSISTDLEGRSRLNRWDLGAFEYWAFAYLPLIYR
jgi:predicted outer membrane repeat protein